ncbi:MAG: WD40 repeat domain-containing protein [Thermoguttaceae bacterium]
MEQGGPLDPAALVVEPAKIRGLRSWTIETPHVRDGWLAFNNYASIESSPDGRYLLAARPTAVRVLDAKTLQTVRILLPTEAWSASWSPDGRLVAIGGRGPEGQPAVRLWDVQSGKIAHCLKLSASASADQVSVCWSPDGRKLGVARRGGGWSISFWDVERGVRLKEYGPEPTGLGPFVFLPDGKTIACAAATGRPNELAVKLLDVATLEPQRSLGVGSDRVGLRLSPDGSLLVGPGPGGKWGILRCWRVADGSVAYDLDAGDRALSATLRFSRDGKLLAVGGRIYDALTGKPLKTLPQRADNRDAQVVALDFSTDGRQLAALYQDHRLVLWDLGTMQMAGSLGGHGGLACPLRFARKGSALAWRDSSQYVHVFRTGQKETLVSFASAKLPNRFQVGTFDLDISPDGQYVREFGTVWDAATGKIIEKGGGKGGQYDIPGRWSPDNQLLVKKDYRIVGIGDPVHGTVREFAKPLAGDARSAWQFSPDGSRLLQMADTVRLFDGASGDLLREIAADKIRGVAWAADGKSIRWMVGGGDKGWLVSDGPTGKPSHKLAGVGWIAGIDFAPSRGLVAVGTDKGNVLLAEVATGKTVSLLDTQVRSDTSPAFTGDDRRLWVGGMNLVRQWDVETARPVVTLLPIEGNRFALISPEGHYRGSPGIEDQLLYVALTDEGEYLTLSGPEFEKQYGWKNDPAKVKSP